jgi:predicted RNase H-like HicB family nuclease
MAKNVNGGAKSVRSPRRTNLKAVLRYDEVSKMYIGYTLGLNIYAQAATEDRAMRTLEGALTLFLSAAQKNRALADMLP